MTWYHGVPPHCVASVHARKNTAPVLSVANVPRTATPTAQGAFFSMTQVPDWQRTRTVEPGGGPASSTNLLDRGAAGVSGFMAAVVAATVPMRYEAGDRSPPTLMPASHKRLPRVVKKVSLPSSQGRVWWPIQTGKARQRRESPSATLERAHVHGSDGSLFQSTRIPLGSATQVWLAVQWRCALRAATPPRCRVYAQSRPRRLRQSDPQHHLH